jgi:ribosomal protein S21|tara:strand:+ start:3096 stop:3287 length:192 start_codon:yes stop_codon:yes gene_type:complete
MRVRVKNNNVDSALRTLKRKTKETLIGLRDKQYYEKASTQRHKSKAAAKVRERKRQRDECKKR